MTTEWKEKIAVKVTEEIYSSYPWLHEKFGEQGKEHTLKDNYHHLDYLETAFLTQSLSVFEKYTNWLIDVLTSRQVPVQLIEDNYERLVNHLPHIQNEHQREFMHQCLEKGIHLVRERSSVN